MKGCIFLLMVISFGLGSYSFAKESVENKEQVGYSGLPTAPSYFIIKNLDHIKNPSYPSYYIVQNPNYPDTPSYYMVINPSYFINSSYPINSSYFMNSSYIYENSFIVNPSYFRKLRFLNNWRGYLARPGRVLRMIYKKLEGLFHRKTLLGKSNKSRFNVKESNHINGNDSESTKGAATKQ